MPFQEFPDLLFIFLAVERAGAVDKDPAFLQQRRRSLQNTRLDGTEFIFNLKSFITRSAGFAIRPNYRPNYSEKFLRITIISFNVIMINYEYYGYFFQFPHRRCQLFF